MSLENYEDVDSRIHRFYEKNPQGRIITHLEHVERKDNGAPVQYIVRAEVYTDTLISTGYAEEVVGATKVNQTSALENCETSAIGRALANAGFSPKGARPSKTEMTKAERTAPEPKVEVVQPTAPDPNDPWITPQNDVNAAVNLVAAEMGGTATVTNYPGPLGRANEKPGGVSERQLKFVNDLLEKLPEVSDPQSALEAANGILMINEYGTVATLGELSKNQANILIDTLKVPF